MAKIKLVTKRDGRVVPFTQDRITNAIYRAAVAGQTLYLCHYPTALVKLMRIASGIFKVVEGKATDNRDNFG
jgi:hypothetical protein